MAHITVQIRPCCTVPFGSLPLDELSDGWQPPVRARVLYDPREDDSCGTGRRSDQRDRRFRATGSGARTK